MAQWGPIASGTQAATRQQSSMRAMAHLSDGTCVFLYTDGTSSTTVLKLAYVNTDRSGSTDIATPDTRIGALLNDWSAIGLCVDASDNIYLVGFLAGSSPASWIAQAFTKGAGLTWTAQTALTVAATTPNSSAFAVKDAVWCNTGGGTSSAGHVLVVASSASTGSAAPVRYAIADAGALLAGTGTLLASQGNNPTFLGSGSTTTTYVNLGSIALAADGFGATTGLAYSATTDLSTAQIGQWAVNSSGVLSTNLAVATGISVSNANQWDNVLFRIGSDLYAFVYVKPSATQWTCATYSSAGLVSGPTDTASPTGMPLAPQSTRWSAFQDPATPTSVWVICTGTAANPQPVARVRCDCSSGVVWDTTAVTETAISEGASGTNTLLRAVRVPRGPYVDWTLDGKTGSTTSGLYGSYSYIPVVTYVRHQNFDTGSLSVTLTNTPAAGNSVVVFAWMAGSATTGVTNITASGLGATWKTVGFVNDNSSRDWVVCVGLDCDGVNNTITLTATGGSGTLTPQTEVVEVAGALSIESASISARTFSATPATPAVTPTTAGDLVVGGWGISTLNSGTTFTSVTDSPGPWTNIADYYSASNTAGWTYVSEVAGKVGSSHQTSATASTGAAGWVAWAVVLSPNPAPGGPARPKLVNRAALFRAARF